MKESNEAVKEDRELVVADAYHLLGFESATNQVAGTVYYTVDHYKKKSSSSFELKTLLE
jgi:hypothetical protein